MKIIMLEMKATKKNITFGVILSILLLNPHLRNTKMNQLLAEFLTTNTGTALQGTLGSWTRVNNFLSKTNTAQILKAVGENSLGDIPGVLYETTPGNIGDASYRILSDVGLHIPLKHVLRDLHSGLHNYTTAEKLKAFSDTSLKTFLANLFYDASVSGN
jgi:hypothetical protein